MEWIVFLVIGYFVFAHLSKNKRKEAVEQNKESILAYRTKFSNFRNATLDCWQNEKKETGQSTDDTSGFIFLRFIVEANEAAMEHFGIPKILRHNLSAINLSDFGFPISTAEEMLTAIKSEESIRDPFTNEELDRYKDLGKSTYKEWLIHGHSAIQSKIEWLYRDCIASQNLAAEIFKHTPPT